MVHINDQLKIGELPRLAILPIDDILFHEEPDEERAELLVAKIERDGILRNPPIVADVNGAKRRILLDGANRITALRRLGFRHVLVQEIDLFDPGLVVSQWHHAVERLDRSYFARELAKIDGLAVGDGTNAEVIARLQFPDGTTLPLCANGDVFHIVHLLGAVTRLYHGSAYMDRVSYTNLDHLRRNYAEFSALVSFRTFTKTEIVELTTNNVKVPSGITRVLVPKRALFFNLPLGVLAGDKSTAELNQWLQEHLTEKIRSKSIRFYQEPTFIFDE
ncbi:MAG: hypothetical protein ONB30_02675 [candidate division KSB1 bacterium]|nr:hypothetical protein [candidate division KSB1 bacterium]